MEGGRCGGVWLGLDLWVIEAVLVVCVKLLGGC